MLPVKLQFGDIRAPQGFVDELVARRGSDTSPAGHVSSLLSGDLNGRLEQMTSEADRRQRVRTYSQLIEELNGRLPGREFYDEDAWSGIRLNREARDLLEQGRDSLTDEETARFNRLAFDAAFDDYVVPAGNEAVQLVYLTWDLGDEIAVAESLLQDVVSAVLSLVVGWLVGNFGVFVALMVTASIVPRMLDTGACDLLLSKPVSRPMLFLSKFFGGCAFILLCSTFLNTGLWLIIGVRFGIWNSGLLWAILVFVFVFAIYYSVSTAAAMIWRSAIISIVFAILFWAACFTVGVTKGTLDAVFLDSRRTAMIMPAGDSLLVTNWEGTGLEWNDDSAGYIEVFRNRREGPPAMVAGYPFLGPLYDANNDRLVAVRLPLQMSWMPAGPGSLAVAQSADDWVPVEGMRVPGDSQSLMLDAEGAIIVAGLDGIHRFQGDPTVASQSFEVLGFQIDMPDTENTFVRLDDESLSWTRPFDAAIDPQAGRMAVISGNTIQILNENAESKFDIVEAADRDDSVPAVVGIAGDLVVVAREDGVIRILNTETLNEREEFRPFGNNEPRAVTTSPDGRWIAVQFHNRKIWLYDAEQTEPSSARLSAQGDISAVAFGSDSTLYAADGFGRVVQYDPANSFSRVDSWEPTPDMLERVYQWGISPIYRVFPKPGEMDNLVSWLMTRQETADEGEPGQESARETQRAVLDIWQPLWSNLAFLTVMLIGTCVYFTRKEF